MNEKKGFELGGKYSNNPIGSEGQSLSQRKAARDGASWTPTEKTIRDGLMKQFCRLEAGNDSQAWRESALWCESCDSFMKRDGTRLCERCHRAAARETEATRMMQGLLSSVSTPTLVHRLGERNEFYLTTACGLICDGDEDEELITPGPGKIECQRCLRAE